MSLTKGCQGSMGSTSSWSFWISLRAERALGCLGFCLTSSLAWYSFWGHLVAMVGGWGTPQAGVAVALLAKIKGGCTVSATVSTRKEGVGSVVVAGSSQSACATGSSTGGVGGYAHKSCTRVQTSNTLVTSPLCSCGLTFNSCTTGTDLDTPAWYTLCWMSRWLASMVQLLKVSPQEHSGEVTCPPRWVD